MRSQSRLGGALAIVLCACGSSGSAGQTDAAGGAGGVLTDAAAPVADVGPDAQGGAGGIAALPDAALPDAAPADGRVPPSGCASACDRLVECYTLPDPPVCACAATAQPDAIRSACLANCNALLSSTIARAGTCEEMVGLVDSASPALARSCGVNGVCPHGGSPPPTLDPACVAYGDRLTQCISESCPSIVPLADGLETYLWMDCSFILANMIPVPFADAATAEDFAALAALPCDEPKMQALVAQRVQPDRQNLSHELLGEFCTDGPVVSPEVCAAACANHDQCTDMALCKYYCEADQFESAAILCYTQTPCDPDHATNDANWRACMLAPRHEPGVLANFPAVDCYTQQVAPAPGEEGQLVASRLTPPSYPWRVDRVQYTNTAELLPEFHCTTAPAAHVEISVVDANVPSNNPVPLAVLPVEGIELPDGSLRFVDLALPEPVTLTEGQSLVVAISLEGAFPDVACVSGCNLRTTEPDRFFWSGTTQAPYHWATLDSFGIPNEYSIFATGAAVE